MIHDTEKSPDMRPSKCADALAHAFHGFTGNDAGALVAVAQYIPDKIGILFKLRAAFVQRFQELGQALHEYFLAVHASEGR